MKIFTLRFIVIFNFAVIFSFSSSCKKEADAPAENETPAGIQAYSGTYRIEPTAGNTLYLDKTGTAVLYAEDGTVIKKGTYTAGKATLRIYFSKSDRPDAVYLLDDYTESGWRGRWDEDFKILYRL